MRPSNKEPEPPETGSSCHFDVLVFDLADAQEFLEGMSRWRFEPTNLNGLETKLNELRASSGEDHPDTLDAMSDVALTVWSSGRTDDGKRLLREIVDRVERNPGIDYKNKHVLLSNMAWLHVGQGEYAEAERFSTDAFEERKGLFDTNHVYSLRSVTLLGAVLLGLNRADEAEALLRDHDAAGSSGSEKETPYWIDFRECYGECLAALGRFAEAIEQIRFCFDAASESDRHERKKYRERLKTLEALAG